MTLLAVTFVAVGLFTSSLTQNQIIAAISSFGLLILLFVISWPAQAGEGAAWALLKYLSLPDHFSTMVRGVIDTSDVVFFLSVTMSIFVTSARSNRRVGVELTQVASAKDRTTRSMQGAE